MDIDITKEEIKAFMKICKSIGSNPVLHVEEMHEEAIKAAFASRDPKIIKQNEMWKDTSRHIADEIKIINYVKNKK